MYQLDYLKKWNKNKNLYRYKMPLKLKSLEIYQKLIYYYIVTTYRNRKGSIKMSLTNQHGGDLDFIEKTYNIPRNEIIDFSGNINPLGISNVLKQSIIDGIDSISTYPDKNYVNLKESIRRYTKTNSIESITCGNGSTELISLFIKTLKPKKSIIISPAYSEYEREIKLSDGQVLLFQLREEDNFVLDLDNLFKELEKDIDFLVLCNPNNPTGSALNVYETENLLSFCKKRNIFVMIDETYVEFTNQENNISSMPLIDKFDNLFIVRGTSKFFAAPGLRLGYAVCSNKNIINKINYYKDPWSVNMLANLAGIKMFDDIQYIKETNSLIDNERKRIHKEISNWNNVKLYNTQSNFFLMKILSSSIKAEQIFNILIKNKMVIRNAADFPFLGENYLRFCILLPEQNTLLLENLKKIFSKGDYL